MARTAPAISCGPEERSELERLAASRTESKKMVERARMIIGCLAGRRVSEVARPCHTRPNTVIKWRQRFVSQGLKGLRDAARSPAAIRRSFSEANSDGLGGVAPGWPSYLGRAGLGPCRGWIGACGLAGAAPRRDQFAAPALLVREHRLGVCRPSSGHGGAVSESTGKGAGGLRRRKAQHPGLGT